MRRLVDVFLSLKLTVTLLALSMVLIFAGTLAQVDKGIWTVMDQYFRCWIAWIELSIFSPSSASSPAVVVPFPGGFLLGSLLSLNLVAVHSSTFKVLVKGRCLWGGYSLLLLGLLITVGVVLGWGTAPVAATENDAFWRVFFRLGRGTLAGAVLFAACWVLYKQRAGMVLLHAGILLLLVGEFFTALFAVEATMTIREGETATFFDRSQQFELVLTDTSDEEVDRVTTIPQSFLKPGKVVSLAALPFDLKVHARISNSNRPIPLDSVSEGLRASYPPYAGYGERLYVARSREVSGATGERNAPAVDVELLDRISGASLGRYILSIWFYPNFVNQIWDMPTTVLYKGRAYELYFRNRREPALAESGSPYAVTLLDFVHERYEGTQTPKDFSSEIRLVNEGDEIDRELRIWMNNPLRYAKRTFYQSGYLPDDEGTVLQVVRNDSWMIPYLSCMIVFIGMAAQFGLSLKRMRKRGAS
ncbi:MAG: cytochrome c biogenesis protein ResB [Pontiellaceae bacterium]